MKQKFNRVKKLLTISAYDRLISKFTQKKDLDSVFVKLLPSNLDYKPTAIRRKKINDISYDLYLNQWMEYALYFGIAGENKNSLYNLIKPGMDVIDVGVNFGETILNIAKLIGPTGHVYGFEPMPYIFQKCTNNINLNRYQNITLENIALSDYCETLIINDPNNGNSGGTFVSKMFNPDDTKIKVKALTMDQYVAQNEIKKINLIKIDVEGFETNVLKGAVQSLKKFKPILFIELSDDNLKRTGSSSKELIEILTESNYKVQHHLSGECINLNNVCNYRHIDVIACYNN